MLCPQFQQSYFNATSRSIDTHVNCNAPESSHQIWLNEFVGMLIFAISWLILRQYSNHLGQLDSGFQGLLKPLVVVLTFYGANAVSGEVQPDHDVEPINTFGGIKIPTLALQLIILDLTYSFEAANPYPHLTSAASQNLFQQAMKINNQRYEPKKGFQNYKITNEN